MVLTCNGTPSRENGLVGVRWGLLRQDFEGIPHLASMRTLRGIEGNAVGLTHSQELVPYPCPLSVLQPRRTQSIEAQNKKPLTGLNC